MYSIEDVKESVRGRGNIGGDQSFIKQGVQVVRTKISKVIVENEGEVNHQEKVRERLRQEVDKVKLKVSPGVMKMRQIFEEQKPSDEVESKEADRESKVKQLSNTFESMMGRERRKMTSREEKQIERDKRERKDKREQNSKRKRVNSSTEMGLERFGIVRNKTEKTEIMTKSETTESRVNSRVVDIERQVEIQMNRNVEKKRKLSSEKVGGSGRISDEGGKIPIIGRVKKEGNWATKSQSQKSKISSSNMSNSLHKIKPETGDVGRHDHGERSSNLTGKNSEKKCAES